MRYAFLLVLLAFIFVPGSSATPPPHSEAFKEALLVPTLVKENRALKAKLKREHASNRYHARIVRKLRASLKEGVSLGSSGVVRGFICIHHFEGGWDAATGNGYFGGLQMDRSFMGTYGGEFVRGIGPANLWPSFLQIAVAMRAYYSGRGFGPWPNTRRSCGV